MKKKKTKKLNGGKSLKVNEREETANMLIATLEPQARPEPARTVQKERKRTCRWVNSGIVMFSKTKKFFNRINPPVHRVFFNIVSSIILFFFSIHLEFILFFFDFYLKRMEKSHIFYKFYCRLYHCFLYFFMCHYLHIAPRWHFHHRGII